MPPRLFSELELEVQQLGFVPITAIHSDAIAEPARVSNGDGRSISGRSQCARYPGSNPPVRTTAAIAVALDTRFATW